MTETSIVVPVNYFVGRSRDWLEAELRSCQEDISAGKTLTSYGSGDVSGGKQVNVSPEERFQRLYYALYLQYPDEYPLAGMRRTTVTVGRHNAAIGA